MSDIKLFRTVNGSVCELEGRSAEIERSLQNQIESNMEDFLGVTFLASEYSTTHGGRMDSIGIDENGCPVIVEYKRSSNENVINQGLFYLDWLLDHRAEFKLVVMDKVGEEKAERIEWSSPRLLCIAGDFNKYDEHAVKQMNRNIELYRYKRYGDDLLLLELVNATYTNRAPTSAAPGTGSKTVREYLAQSDQELKDRFESVRSYCMALGDDVQEKELKNYFAFKRIKNFACVEVHPATRKVLIYVKVSPDDIDLEEGFTRDVRNIGHFGTGNLEITLSDSQDLRPVELLLYKSYELS